MSKLFKVISLTIMLSFLLNYLPQEMQQEVFKSNKEVQAFELLSEAEPNERQMRVRLRNYLGDQTTIPMSVNGSYQIVEDESITLEPNKSYRITVNGNGQLQLLEETTLLKTFPSSFTVIPEHYNEEHYLFIDRRAYLGQVDFTVENSKFIRPMNTLRLEDYLKSVVPHEMPASWGSNGGMEALKAQALAARSYAMRRSHLIIDDTQTFQVYGGYKSLNANNQPVNVWHLNSTKAVIETKGEVVLSGSSIADTVYSSSNGGVVESSVGAWGGEQKNFPYLLAKADPLDPKHKWSFTVAQQQIQNLDLKTPNQWWNSNNEQNMALSNRLKQSLLSLNAYRNVHSLKINSINSATFSDQTAGQRLRNATFDLSFYVKDKGTLNVHELFGDTRWDTNKVITEFGWKEQNGVVIIGRGDQSADALTGNVLATKYNAPILLTSNNKLREQVVDELTRLKPSKVYILGGPLAISASVEKQIKSLVPEKTPVQRIEGNNRYVTSIEIAKEINSPSKSIILAPAYDGKGKKESPDALTIGPFAGNNQIPILLTEKNRLRDEIKKYIIDHSITQVYLLGGDLVVSDTVEQELRKITKVERIAGQTRFETSTKIAERFPLNNANVFFARGDNHTDALSAAPLATRERAPIILTRTTSVPNEVKNWLNKEKSTIQRVYFLGGPLAIEDGTRDAIKNLLLYRLNNDGTLMQFNEKVTISTAQLRSVIGGSVMKSTLFDSNAASLSNGVFIVSGKGFGHGVGMSQFGAYERSKVGHTYREILAFYYPNTTIAIR